MRLSIKYDISVNYYVRTELPRKRDKLQGLKKSYIEKQAISQRLQVRASQLNDDIAALQTTTEKHLVAFETQHALRLEEIAALAVTFQESRANRDAKYQELQALQMQKGTTKHTINYFS